MTYRTHAIQEALRPYPNAHLSVTPTPIHKLSRLSDYLNRNIYIKREDLTGFGIGGNKVRKLDFLIGDALAKKADTLITAKATSFSRNAAAAGRVFELEVHVVLVGDESQQNASSQTLFQQCDTHLYYTRDTGESALQTEYDRVLQALIGQGKTVYELHPGGSDTIGALGYVNAFDEIVHYSTHEEVHFNAIVHSTGSTATQVGLLLGSSISEYETRNIGIASSQPADVQIRRINDLALPTANMLDIPFDGKNTIVEDAYIGPGYAIPSEEGMAAAKLFSTKEGVLLDDVYTAKAAAGLIDYAKTNRFTPKDNVLFIHTGGNAGLYY